MHEQAVVHTRYRVEGLAVDVHVQEVDSKVSLAVVRLPADAAHVAASRPHAS